MYHGLNTRRKVLQSYNHSHHEWYGQMYQWIEHTETSVAITQSPTQGIVWLGVLHLPNTLGLVLQSYNQNTSAEACHYACTVHNCTLCTCIDVLVQLMYRWCVCTPPTMHMQRFHFTVQCMEKVTLTEKR